MSISWSELTGLSSLCNSLLLRGAGLPEGDLSLGLFSMEVLGRTRKQTKLVGFILLYWALLAFMVNKKILVQLRYFSHIVLYSLL